MSLKWNFIRSVLVMGIFTSSAWSDDCLTLNEVQAYLLAAQAKHAAREVFLKDATPFCSALIKLAGSHENPHDDMGSSPYRFCPQCFSDNSSSTLLADQKTNLNPDQLCAIQYYTGSGYGPINSSLTTWLASDKKQAQPLLNALEGALNQLSDYRGIVKAGETFSPEMLEHYKKIKVGETLTFPGYLSTSTDHPFIGNIQFEIQSLHGKKISQFSSFPEEDEVLLKAGSHFKVIAAGLIINPQYENMNKLVSSMDDSSPQKEVMQDELAATPQMIYRIKMVEVNP